MTAWVVGALVVGTVIFIVDVWWFAVTLHCFKYIQHKAKKASGRDHEAIIWETDASSTIYKRTVDGCIIYTAKKDTMGL